MSQDSPFSFSWRIFASSSGAYLALFEVGLGFAVVSLSFVNLVLLCLAEKCLLDEETERPFSVGWWPIPRSAHGSQVNCSWKVATPSTSEAGDSLSRLAMLATKGSGGCKGTPKIAAEGSPTPNPKTAARRRDPPAPSLTPHRVNRVHRRPPDRHPEP